MIITIIGFIIIIIIMIMIIIKTMTIILMVNSVRFADDEAIVSESEE